MQLTCTEVRSGSRLWDSNLERKGSNVKLELKGDEERSSEGVYGPGITKETKSEATMVPATRLIYRRTSTTISKQKASHSEAGRRVSGSVMG